MNPAGPPIPAVSAGSSAINAQFPEWLDLHPSEPIRQGDVLASIDQDADSWHALMIVLTADCDLARSKHAGALTCIPILTSTDYLIKFRFEKVRETSSRRIVDFLLGMRAPGKPGTAAAPRISARRMHDWVLEAEPISVVEALGLYGPERARFSDLADALRNLEQGDPQSLSEAIDLLTTAKVTLGDTADVAKARSSIAHNLVSTLHSLPGDAFFLNQVSPEHGLGYVAYLRRVLEIDESSVVTSRSQIPFQAHYRRLARLRSPYIYALSQQFSAVFSAIGLPSEYELARSATTERLKSPED